MKMNKCLLCSTEKRGRPAFYASEEWYVGLTDDELDITYYPNDNSGPIPIAFPINYCPNCGGELGGTE